MQYCVPNQWLQLFRHLPRRASRRSPHAVYFRRSGAIPIAIPRKLRFTFVPHDRHYWRCSQGVWGSIGCLAATRTTPRRATGASCRRRPVSPATRSPVETLLIPPRCRVQTSCVGLSTSSPDRSTSLLAMLTEISDVAHAAQAACPDIGIVSAQHIAPQRTAGQHGSRSRHHA